MDYSKQKYYEHLVTMPKRTRWGFSKWRKHRAKRKRKWKTEKESRKKNR